MILRMVTNLELTCEGRENPYEILNRWKNYCCQLLNIHGVGGVRKTEMHATEPLVPESSASEDEVAIGNLKSYKFPGVDRIPAELYYAGGEIPRSEIHKLIKLITKRTASLAEKSVVAPIHKKG
jgi:hypothetical protein